MGSDADSKYHICTMMMVDSTIARKSMMCPLSLHYAEGYTMAATALAYASANAIAMIQSSMALVLWLPKKRCGICATPRGGS